MSNKYLEKIASLTTLGVKKLTSGNPLGPISKKFTFIKPNTKLLGDSVDVRPGEGGKAFKLNPRDGRVYSDYK